MESRGPAGGGWLLLEARLLGGAPWGFSLQGGLEHGEPLLISKVEEGGKATHLDEPLQVGDEIIIINDVELSGYRQEAVALIKGSFKTLKIAVRREFNPGYIEGFTTPSSVAAPRLPTPPPALRLQSPPLSPLPQQETPSSNHSRPCSAVQLRIKNGRSEQSSRPHSWHSTKLGEGHSELEQERMDSMGTSWHHSYPTSASTVDISSGFDISGGYLRKSPDQYSSRGSMDSLDPTQSSRHHSEIHQQHPLGHRSQSGSHPAYSSCQQLSSARSSNSIDHLHSKRDSAYSSFSTSSSIPEYLASTPSFSPERSYSLETVPQRGGGSSEMLQADIRYVRSVYDAQQGLSQEHELNSSRGGVRSGAGRDHQGSVGGVCYRGPSSSNVGGGNSSDVPASNRHSVGPIWGQATSRTSYESLKGAPAPPRRSDSYAAIRNHDRPNSWSSLDHARSLRSLQKGSWHHSSGPVATAKGSYGIEGQLHTVIEKSPESSPTIKPRQGGGLSRPPSPTGPSSPTSQTSHLILPASVYPVPQPEPQFAQTPSSGTGLGTSGVYIALTMESDQQHGFQVEERLSAAENGHQRIGSSPHSHSSYSGPGSSELRSRVPEAQSWHQQPEFNTETHKSHGKTTGGESEGLTGAQRPYKNHETFSQKFDESFLSHGSNQEQNHEFKITPVHLVPEQRTLLSQGRADPTDKSRQKDQPSFQSEPPAATTVTASTPHPSARLFSDSEASKHQNWNHRDSDKDSEHPLTRLEIALAEVQRCASPDSSNNNGTHSPARSLSVLEKVSHFEQRNDGGKQRSLSTNCYGKSSYLGMTDKGRSSPCGAEDLRNMLERSTKGTKTHRTMSYRGGGSNDYMKQRPPADPISALQRSRSSFQLEGSKDGDVGKNFSWQHEPHELMDPTVDASTSRSYRESLKDAQTNVLRSTSFRKRELSSSDSSPLSGVFPSAGPQPFAHHAKYNSLEKKGPKTKPKPQGVVITQQPQVMSPHTPKERHAVSPDNGGQTPPPLPSVPPVGTPYPTRICGRKRLTADQKKRSYSEPENMNEVGVCDPETNALFRRGGETSVADRRRLFEFGASHVHAGAPQGAVSRSDMRQVCQDALAEYVERKRGFRREDGGQRIRTRPRSAYMQPELGYNTDSYSLSSTSSMLSLQDAGPDQSFLPLGSDLRSLQSNLFYPGRVTTPRPPAQPITGSSFSSSLDLQTQEPNPKAGIDSHSGSASKDSDRDQDRQTAEPQYKPGFSKKLDEALERAGLTRPSGRSASAEDLLERLENQYAPQHARSRSSPTAEKLDQNLLSGDVKMFGVCFSEFGRCALAADRPADIRESERFTSPQSSRNNEGSNQPAGSSQDVAHTPVTRRERQRNVERFRADSTSTLAASVGLPFPLSASGNQQDAAAEWRACERLSQGYLDSITFPESPQTNDGESGMSPVGGDGDGQTRRGLSDAGKEGQPGGTFSLESTESQSVGSTRPASPVSSALPPDRKTIVGSSHQSVQPHQSSLRISESSLIGSFEQPLQTSTGIPQEDFNEVFLQDPPPPHPPLTSPTKDLMEDFLPPPPPLTSEIQAGHQSLKRGSEIQNNTHNSSVQSSPPSKPQTEDVLVFQYQPLPRRDKMPEELRVETLSRRLAVQDPSLEPLLQTWGGECTMKLMEEIFATSSLSSEAQRKRSGSSLPGERIQADVCEPSQDQKNGTDVEDEPTDLQVSKGELCEALRSCVAALEREKQALFEEQRRHQALGASIEALIQEQLKANEKEKYNIFIGDLERIVNLLLSLCSRLSKVDRSLLSLEKDELRWAGLRRLSEATFESNRRERTEPSMAAELSQDSVLEFLQSRGGSVKNTELLLHFRSFLRDHRNQDRNRQLFKTFVNSVATVTKIDGVSSVVLRNKFRIHVPGAGSALPAAGILVEEGRNQRDDLGPELAGRQVGALVPGPSESFVPAPNQTEGHNRLVPVHGAGSAGVPTVRHQDYIPEPIKGQEIHREDLAPPPFRRQDGPHQEQFTEPIRGQQIPLQDYIAEPIGGLFVNTSGPNTWQEIPHPDLTYAPVRRLDAPHPGNIPEPNRGHIVNRQDRVPEPVRGQQIPHQDSYSDSPRGHIVSRQDHVPSPNERWDRPNQRIILEPTRGHIVSRQDHVPSPNERGDRPNQRIILEPTRGHIVSRQDHVPEPLIGQRMPKTFDQDRVVEPFRGHVVNHQGHFLEPVRGQQILQQSPLPEPSRSRYTTHQDPVTRLMRGNLISHVPEPPRGQNISYRDPSRDPLRGQKISAYKPIIQQQIPYVVPESIRGQELFYQDIYPEYLRGQQITQNPEYFRGRQPPQNLEPFRGQKISHSPEPLKEPQILQNPEYFKEQHSLQNLEHVTGQKISYDPHLETNRSQKIPFQDPFPEHLIGQSISDQLEHFKGQKLPQQPEPLLEHQVPQNLEPLRRQKISQKPEPIKGGHVQIPFQNPILEPLKGQPISDRLQPLEGQKLPETLELLEGQITSKIPEPISGQIISKSPEPVSGQIISKSPEPIRGQIISKSPEPIRRQKVQFQDPIPEPLEEQQIPPQLEPLLEHQVPQSPPRGQKIPFQDPVPQPPGGPQILHQDPDPEPPIGHEPPHQDDPQYQAPVRHFRHRKSYKSAVSQDDDDDEDEVPLRRGSGGQVPLNAPLSDAGRATSASSPCIIDGPPHSSGTKFPQIHVRDSDDEALASRGPSGFNSGPEPASDPVVSTRRSLPASRASKPGPSQNQRLSSSQGNIFDAPSDVRFSIGDWPPSGPSRASDWTGSSTAGDPAAARSQEVLRDARGTYVEPCRSNARIPLHQSMGNLCDDQQLSGRLSPTYQSCDHLHDDQQFPPRGTHFHQSAGDLYDDVRSSDGSIDSPPVPLRSAGARRVSSRLRNRNCRSLGTDLDQEDLAEGNEIVRLKRLDRISSSLSLPHHLSSSSLSSCATPPRCPSPVAQVEVEGRKEVRRSLQAQHTGQSAVPLDPKEHAWMVKAAAGDWPDIYTLFRDDNSLLNRQDFISGFTVLHWIAKHGNHRVLNTLWYGVEKSGMSFDVNARSSAGQTPLHIAAMHCHKNIIRLLVKNFSADVKLRDMAGKKPWQYIGDDKSPEILQLLGAPQKAPLAEEPDSAEPGWRPPKKLHHLRHRFSSASPAQRPLTLVRTAKVSRSTSIGALLKHKPVHRF